MPLRAAHVAIGAETCGRAMENLAMYGERVVTTEDAAFITTMGFFASVATGAAAIASGVKPKPARKSTLSRVTSSCARRLATSGLGPPVSRMRSWILRPAKVSPCSLKKALIPPSICLP